MKNLTKAFLVAMVSLVVFCPLALAQGGELPDGSVDWLFYAAMIINSAVIPIAVNFLKPAWAAAPSWLKSFVPVVVGSLLALAEAYLLNIGLDIDLSLLEAVFMGVGGGAAATMGFKQGKGSTSNR